MYNNYTGVSGCSPPLPDIIGQYYGPPAHAYGPGPVPGLGLGPGNGYGNAYDLYGPSTSSGGYLYDPGAAAAAAAAAQIYGQSQTSPIRRRRYSIAGLPSATMYNDVYGYPAPPQHQTSSSNIVNLLNEAHKSISRSSQILNLSNQARQLGQLVTTPLGGRVVSSYPTLHPGDTSPPYLNDNLLQMSTSFSSQPNMYFQPQPQQAPLPTQLTAAQSAAAAAARLRPAYSVTNLVSGYPSSAGLGMGMGMGAGMGVGACKYGMTGYANPYQSEMQNSSGYGGLGLGLGPFQQRQLMSQSLHASNPAISQYYQQQHQPSASSAAALAYNLQQQFAGSHHYGSGGQPPLGHSHIQASVQQQMHPQYQYHVHQHQNHLQTHPLASLANTSGPFGGTLASSARDGLTGAGYEGLHHSHPHQSHSHLHTHPHSHHSSHHHHSAYPHSLSHHQQQPHQQHHHHHLPYSKLDLDYPKLPQEHKRQLDEFRLEIQRRDQEILAMAAKMKTLEEQHQDYQRHIAVLKESLCAKEEHYNMLHSDVEEMRARLEEKNRLIEKKTQGTLQTVQERNRLTSELTELKDHMDIKDRKISVLQRKIENLEDLLKEKDNQVDMARARLSAMQAHHSSSEGALTSLEEAIGDKEKQMAQLRDQRDRAEHEKQEERDLHEREVADYKIKLRAAESDVEKLQTRLERAVNERERLEIKLEASQSELGKSTFKF